VIVVIVHIRITVGIVENRYSNCTSCIFETLQLIAAALSLMQLDEVLAKFMLFTFITDSISKKYSHLKGQCHEMVIEMSPWSRSLGLN
jgi:hypothetical protein